MKKFLLLLIIPFLSFGQQTYVPDDVFEECLIIAGYDDVLDNYVLTSNINMISSIVYPEWTNTQFQIDGQTFYWDWDMISPGSTPQPIPPIFDLTGINDFTLLQELTFTSQYLSSLDLSGLFYLQDVDLDGNYLECLDVTGCVSLSTLDVPSNFLSQLDVSSCISLETMSFYEYENNPFLDCIQIGDNPNWQNDGQLFQVDCNYTENLDCSSSSIAVVENNREKSLLTKLDLLGRETTNKGFQLHIYDDGTVEKKYLIK